MRTFKVLGARSAPYVLSLLATAALAAAPTYVRTVRAGAFEAATVSLPGFLVDTAGITGPGGRPGVALLLSAQKDLKGPKSLWLFDPERRTLERLAAGLNGEVNAVAGFDLSGGKGALSAVAGMPGVFFAPASGGVRKVAESEAIDLRSVAAAGPERPWIPVAHTGVLELLAPAGGTLARRMSLPLPVRAERQHWGLRLASPPVTLLPGDPPTFAAGPEVEGRRRLKTLLLTADAAAPIEAWSLLPANERLMRDRRYLRLDGTPALAATTFEQIGVFAKKRFRLFLLGRDRSRKGSPPALAVETDCPLWFPVDAVAADADGDGKQDLVLVYPGGLRGKELQVAAYRSLGGGKFDPAHPRRWKLNDRATDWHYGADLTGDGVPDLLVLAGDHLLLYPGDLKGSRPLAGRPLWSFPVSGAPKLEARGDDDVDEFLRERVVEVLDLPGGGRIALARGSQGDGRTVLTFVERR
ncbi:MAG TPA: VCBS repeat-containing protein [Thermoanaerobaculia bacterium]